MKFIYILLLFFVFIHTGICAQGYDDSISIGNGEVTKKRGAKHMIGLDFRPSYVFPTYFLPMSSSKEPTTQEKE